MNQMNQNFFFFVYSFELDLLVKETVINQISKNIWSTSLYERVRNENPNVIRELYENDSKVVECFD